MPPGVEPDLGKSFRLYGVFWLELVLLQPMCHHRRFQTLNKSATGMDFEERGAFTTSIFHNYILHKSLFGRQRLALPSTGHSILSGNSQCQGRTLSTAQTKSSAVISTILAAVNHTTIRQMILWRILHWSKNVTANAKFHVFSSNNGKLAQRK